MHRLPKYMQYAGTIYNRYPSAYATLTNETAVDDLIDRATSRPWSKYYLWLDKITIAVSKAAIGGAGILEIRTLPAEQQDTVTVWTMDVSSVKEFVLDFGENGVQVESELGLGLQALVSGADEQATVSIAVEAHYEVEGE